MPTGERDYSGIQDAALLSTLKNVDQVSGELELPTTAEGLINSPVRMAQRLTQKDFRSFIRATKDYGLVLPDYIERRTPADKLRLMDGYNWDHIGALVVVNRGLIDISLSMGKKTPYGFYDSIPWDEVYRYSLGLVSSNPLREFIKNPADLDKNLENRALSVQSGEPDFVPENRMKLGRSGDHDARDLRTFFPEYSESQLATLEEYNIHKMELLLAGAGTGGKFFDNTNHDIIPEQVIPHEVQVFMKLYASRVINREIKVMDELTFAFGGRILRSLILALRARQEPDRPDKLNNLKDTYELMKKRLEQPGQP